MRYLNLWFLTLLLPGCSNSESQPDPLPGRSVVNDKWEAGHHTPLVVDHKPSKGGKAEKIFESQDVSLIKAAVGARAQVRGRVISTHVARSKKVLYLNMGSNWKTCFKVVIFAKAFEKWNAAPHAIANRYVGKQIHVEGTVTEYQGKPQMIANVPSQIEMIK